MLLPEAGSTVMALAMSVNSVPVMQTSLMLAETVGDGGAGQLDTEPTRVPVHAFSPSLE